MVITYKSSRETVHVGHISRNECIRREIHIWSWILVQDQRVPVLNCYPDLRYIADREPLTCFTNFPLVTCRGRSFRGPAQLEHGGKEPLCHGDRGSRHVHRHHPHPVQVLLQTQVVTVFSKVCYFCISCPRRVFSFSLMMLPLKFSPPLHVHQHVYDSKHLFHLFSFLSLCVPPPKVPMETIALGVYCLWKLFLCSSFDQDNGPCKFMLILMKGVMPTVADFSPPDLFRGSHYLQRERISMWPGNANVCPEAKPRTTSWGSVTSLRYHRIHFSSLLPKCCSDWLISSFLWYCPNLQ